MKLSCHLVDPSNFIPHYCIGLANGLSDIGVDTDLWSSDWPYEDLAVYQRRFTEHRDFFRRTGKVARGSMSLRQVLKGLEYTFGLRRVLSALAESSDGAILHVQWIVVPFIDKWFWRRVRARRIPIVYTAHNPLPHDHRPSDVSRYRWFYEHADSIIVHAQHNRDELVTHFPTVESKVQVVPFGEFSSFLDVFPKVERGEARSRLGLQQDDQVVLFFGNIAPYKGVDILIEALAGLVSDLPKLKLLIVGKCTRGNFYSYGQQIEAAGLAENVKLHLHHVPTSENNLYYSASDVCVLPYRHASQSMTLFMAFANGTPVIVSRTGGLADVVEDGVSGLITEPSSAEGLRRSLASFFALSKADRDAMGACGKKRSDKEFNWQRIGEMTRGIYMDAANL